MPVRGGEAGARRALAMHVGTIFIESACSAADQPRRLDKGVLVDIRLRRCSLGCPRDALSPRFRPLKIETGQITGHEHRMGTIGICVLL